jgi:hypothetical protein
MSWQRHPSSSCRPSRTSLPSCPAHANEERPSAIGGRCHVDCLGQCPSVIRIIWTESLCIDFWAAVVAWADPHRPEGHTLFQTEQSVADKKFEILSRSPPLRRGPRLCTRKPCPPLHIFSNAASTRSHHTVYPDRQFIRRFRHRIRPLWRPATCFLRLHPRPSARRCPLHSPYTPYGRLGPRQPTLAFSLRGPRAASLFGTRLWHSAPSALQATAT